ncbi:MAG: cofactor assembly of complex C subunit B [Leptolyngbyaceae cyanobacterium]
MTEPIQLISPSIITLTVVLAIGLVFFIRASTKDRFDKESYSTEMDDIALLETLQQYFANRAYQVTAANPESGSISLKGKVGASIFMAIFLGSLAGIGFACLALVLAIAYPQLGYWPYGLLILSPLASWFYWRGSTRVEQVDFQVTSVGDSTTRGLEQSGAQLRVSAHRDELAVLESQLALKRKETE